MCIESKTIEHAQSADPIIQQLTKGDTTHIPFYRWRQIRDYAFRIDDGRHGVPYMLIALDRSAEDGVGDLRSEVKEDCLEYLIRSERIIAAGPIHLPTEFKDDPSSTPVGDFLLFNAEDREEAVEFAENMPSVLKGLYGSMKIHKYNSLDVTGKFVSTNIVNPHKTKHTEDMKEAMGHRGYPTNDMETKWLNW